MNEVKYCSISATAFALDSGAYTGLSNAFAQVASMFPDNVTSAIAQLEQSVKERILAVQSASDVVSNELMSRVLSDAIAAMQPAPQQPATPAAPVAPAAPAVPATPAAPQPPVQEYVAPVVPPQPVVPPAPVAPQQPVAPVVPSQPVAAPAPVAPAPAPVAPVVPQPVVAPAPVVEPVAPQQPVAPVVPQQPVAPVVEPTPTPTPAPAKKSIAPQKSAKPAKSVKSAEQTDDYFAYEQKSETQQSQPNIAVKALSALFMVLFIVVVAVAAAVFVDFAGVTYLGYMADEVMSDIYIILGGLAAVIISGVMVISMLNKMIFSRPVSNPLIIATLVVWFVCGVGSTSYIAMNSDELKESLVKGVTTSESFKKFAFEFYNENKDEINDEIVKYNEQLGSEMLQDDMGVDSDEAPVSNQDDEDWDNW